MNLETPSFSPSPSLSLGLFFLPPHPHAHPPLPSGAPAHCRARLFPFRGRDGLCSPAELVASSRYNVFKKKKKKDNAKERFAWEGGKKQSLKMVQLLLSPSKPRATREIHKPNSVLNRFQKVANRYSNVCREGFAKLLVVVFLFFFFYRESVFKL